MQAQMRVEPWWAALTVWGVVNAVNVLQAAGFLSRVFTGTLEINHVLGYIIVALGVPAAAALFAFVKSRANWKHTVGPAVFLFFIGFMLSVEYIGQVEFRSPARAEILIPYLLLFFGSILLMGLPMFRMNRRLWFITAVTTIILLISMVVAMYMGVG